MTFDATTGQAFATVIGFFGCVGLVVTLASMIVQIFSRNRDDDSDIFPPEF